MTQNWVQVAYLVAAVCFILALKGLSSPKYARRGNLIGAFGATLAVVVTLVAGHFRHVPLILVAIVVGSVVAVPTARRVAMTAMPQLVALFNGVGGAAAALVAIVEFLRVGQVESTFSLAASVFTVLVGERVVQRIGRHVPEAAGTDDLAPGGLPWHEVAAWY